MSEVKAIPHIDVQAIRKDFPILQTEVYGKPLVYLDNAASTQKPKAVIDAISGYYGQTHANVHRGNHFLSEKATAQFEETRETVRQHINAAKTAEIIYTKGTTESINLVAYSFGEAFVKAGDEIVITTMDHHSNIVPWQMLCERKNAKLKVIPINDRGEILMDEAEKLITEKTALVAFNHVSNTLGTVNPAKELTQLAKARNAYVLIDGAQAAPHLAIDVREIGCDFYAFSGHKLFGPTGTGILYGKEALLEAMPPYQGGGEMIEHVSFEKTTYNELPHKFEAGTPNIAGVIGFKEAIKYVNAIGLDAIAQYENDLLCYATDRLKSEFPEIRFIGEAEGKTSVISFLLGDVHPYDVGTLLDKMGIAVRTGHHCTEPLMTRFGIAGTVRASFAFYNTKAEVDKLIDGLHRVKRMMS